MSTEETPVPSHATSYTSDTPETDHALHGVWYRGDHGSAIPALCRKLERERNAMRLRIIEWLDMPDEAIRLDAARYRWLRSQNWNDGRLAVVVDPKRSVKPGHDCPSLNRLDEMIDEQMKRSQ